MWHDESHRIVGLLVMNAVKEEMHCNEFRMRHCMKDKSMDDLLDQGPQE
jgi:hypothetical protein